MVNKRQLPWVLRSVSLAILMALGNGAAAQTQSAPVFPKAVGFGVNTTAGTEGRVLRVTNLNSDGPGSLRAALDAVGPRLVVFDVGGVIDLGQKELVVREPFLTIAGQTAPAPGITLIRGGISLQAHDVLIQHIRVRPGDAGQPRRSGWEPDGLATWGDKAYNIVIDHCSFTWAVDENLSASGPRLEGPEATTRRITFSNCIIAEGLLHSTHQKDGHSMGTLIHDFCRDIAVIGNLFAHNQWRNPYFKAHTTGVVVNNVIYNPGEAAILLGYPLSEWTTSALKPANARVSIVGNVLIHGQNTKTGLPLVTRQGDAYLEDNLAFDRDGKPGQIHDKNVNLLAEEPVWPAGLQAARADRVVEQVIHNAGARPRERDEIDQRIIRDFQERTGQIINSQNEVGGYPQHAAVTRVLDVPKTNRREWLAQLADQLE